MLIMTLDGLYTLARGIALIESIAVVILALLLVRSLGGWKISRAADRFRYSGGILLAGAWGYGCIEAQLQGVTGGMRSLFGAIALGYLGIGYYLILRDQKEVAVRGVQDDGGSVK